MPLVEQPVSVHRLSLTASGVTPLHGRPWMVLVVGWHLGLVGRVPNDRLLAFFCLVTHLSYFLFLVCYSFTT